MTEREREECGVSSPHAEVPSLCSGQALLFRQKDPNPWAPGGGKSAGRMRCGPYNLDSPRPHIRFGTAAQPRLEAPGGGAMGWRATEATEGGIRCRHYRGDRARTTAPSSVAAPSHGAVFSLLSSPTRSGIQSSKGSRAFSFPSVCENNDAGFLLKTCSCRLGPLLCSGRISCGLLSFRFLAASSGGMRCRPYN